ncbi:TolB family protein [Gemmatimonadota bacterium]
MIKISVERHGCKVIRFGLVSVVLVVLSFIQSAALAQQLRIVEPTDDDVVYAGASVRLVARWSGSTAGVIFRWVSDIDGPLGSGLETPTEALSYASHLVAVEALSGDSVLARAETTVHVITSPEQFTLSERTDWEGEFSRSGRQVAYASFRTGDSEVLVADVESRFAERITFNGGRTPVWSPDGLSLAFWSERSGSRDIWLVELSSKPREAVRLTKSSAAEWMPAFHPTEQKIAYIAKRGRELRLMQLEITAEDTTAVELVGPEQYPMFPRWTADGKSLLFTSLADSLPVMTIFSLESGALVKVGPAGCEDGDISPDGGRVLLARGGELFLLTLADGSLRPLTREAGGVLSPRFSPDGSRALFATTRSGNYDLWLLNLPPGR